MPLCLPKPWDYMNRVTFLERSKTVYAGHFDCENELYALSCGDNKWTSIPYRFEKFPHDVNHLSSLFQLDDQLYGHFFDENWSYHSIAKYKEKARVWENAFELSSLKGVGYSTVVGHPNGRKVYTVGGVRDGQSLTLVTVYDVQTGVKYDDYEMKDKRGLCSCAIIHDVLYIGGGDIWQEEAGGLNSIESLFLENRHCELFSPTTSYRPTLGALGDSLVYSGGTVDASCSDASKKVGRLDFRAKKWVSLPDMQQERDLHGMVAVDGQSLFAVGGTPSYYSVDRLDSFEQLSVTSIYV